jgi:hypothetical protein
MAGEPVGQDRKMSWGAQAAFASLPASPNQFLGKSVAFQLFTGRYILAGISFSETAGTAGVLTVHDGQDATGEILGVFPYAANGGVNQLFGVVGAMSEIGVYMSISAGTITGTLLAVPTWTYDITAPGQ